MTTQPESYEDELRRQLSRQLSRLIIENRSEDGSITYLDQKTMCDEILALIAQQKREAQHLHSFNDETYKCIYCDISFSKLADNTSKLQSSSGEGE